MSAPTPDLRISVVPPNTKLVPGVSSIRLDQLFLHEDFELTLERSGEAVRVDLPVQEWLPAIASHLRANSGNPANQLLTQSGARFLLRKTPDGFQFGINPKQTRSLRWLDLRVDELKVLHATLLSEFVKAVDAAAGSHLAISDLHRAEIDESVWASLEATS